MSKGWKVNERALGDLRRNRKYIAIKLADLEENIEDDEDLAKILEDVSCSIAKQHEIIDRICY